MFREKITGTTAHRPQGGRSLVEIDRFGAPNSNTRFADRGGYARSVNTNQSISSVTASAGLILAP